MTTLSKEAIRKLDSLIQEGVSIKEKHKVERDGLNEAIKAISEEFDLKPKSIRTAINVAFKANFNEETEFHDEVTSILETTGRTQ